MITSPTGWLAVFRTDEETHSLPVDGWTKEGEALVVNVANGYRQVARHMANYVGLNEAEPLIVAALPGAGWAVDYGQGDEPDPVVGWAVNAHGVAIALSPDSDGQATPLWGCPGQLVPPAAAPTDTPIPKHLSPELRAMYERGFKDGCAAAASDF